MERDSPWLSGLLQLLPAIEEFISLQGEPLARMLETRYNGGLLIVDEQFNNGYGDQELVGRYDLFDLGS